MKRSHRSFMNIASRRTRVSRRWGPRTAHEAKTTRITSQDNRETGFPRAAQTKGRPKYFYWAYRKLVSRSHVMPILGVMCGIPLRTRGASSSGRTWKPPSVAISKNVSIIVSILHHSKPYCHIPLTLYNHHCLVFSHWITYLSYQLTSFTFQSWLKGAINNVSNTIWI